MNVFHALLLSMRPIINARGVEVAAGLPKNTLGKHYRWVDEKPNGQPCHQKHFPAIVRVLCSVFGTVEIDEWRITCETDGMAIFATKYIPDKEPEVIEINGMFEYRQPEWRCLYDDFDFSAYFGQ